jgi:hypothetical protein
MAKAMEARRGQETTYSRGKFLQLLAGVAVGGVVGTGNTRHAVASFVAAFEKGYNQEDTAKSKEVPKQAAAVAVKQDVAVAPVAQPSTPESIDMNITFDGWRLAPNYIDLILSNPRYNEQQKEFQKRAVEGIYFAKLAGYKFNPRAVFGQTSIETSNGNDTLSGPNDANNFMGMKWHENDDAGKHPFVTRLTHEFQHGKWVKVQAKFTKFESPADCFKAYGAYVESKKFYAASIACRTDDKAYISDLVNYDDPTTCKTILPQGTTNDKGKVIVTSYATAPNYEEIVYQRLIDLRADEIFPRVEA